MNTLFSSEKVYRIITVLLAYAESGFKEALIPDIAQNAQVPYGVVLYWLNKFEIYGFIDITRYKNRANANNMYNRHIVVHLTRKKTLDSMYNAMWIQEWEKRMLKDLNVPQLSIIKKVI